MQGFANKIKREGKLAFKKQEMERKCALNFLLKFPEVCTVKHFQYFIKN